ncbi:hypothetical protein CR513_19440, partial [Mucuna pruriens]
MVITIKVTNFVVKKVLIDQGSFVNIHYMSTFRRLQILESKIRPHHNQLVKFLREHVDTHRYIDLLTTCGDTCVLRIILVYYLIVEADTYHSIHPTLGHGVPFFRWSSGNRKAGTKPPRENHVSAHVKISTDVELDPRPPIEQGVIPIEKLEKVSLTKHPRRRKDTRDTSRTVDIHPLVACQPIHRNRPACGDRQKSIEQETAKHKVARFIRECLSRRVMEIGGYVSITQIWTKSTSKTPTLVEHRLASRQSIEFSGAQFFGCIFRLQSDPDVSVERGQEGLHDRRTDLLLSGHALWLGEHRSHLLMSHRQSLR